MEREPGLVGVAARELIPRLPLCSLSRSLGATVSTLNHETAKSPAAAVISASDLRPIVCVDIPKERSPTGHDEGFRAGDRSPVVVLVPDVFSLAKSCWPFFETRPTAKIVYEWVVCRIKTSPGCVGMRLAIDAATGPALAYREVM